jgi:exopolysaccharide production protein ExoZ
MSNINQINRNENLQILRFLAAAIVLITHTTFYINERIDSNFIIWSGGAEGVDIFFVISGFVMYVAGKKFSRNAIGAKLFIRRRIARVFPLYWLITTFKVSIALIAPAAVLHNHPNALNVIGSYLLIPMLNADGEVRPLHGVGWTLLHEMFFYYAFSLSLLLRQNPAIFSSVIIGSLWCIGLFVHSESALATVYFSTLNLLFIAGMVLAFLYERGLLLPKIIAYLTLLGGISVIINPEIQSLRFHFFGKFCIEAVLIAASLISIKFVKPTKLKKALVNLGDSSYSLYMIHPILAPGLCLILNKFHYFSNYTVLIITFFTVIVAAHLVYLFIEKPLNNKAAYFLEKFCAKPTPVKVN